MPYTTLGFVFLAVFDFSIQIPSSLFKVLDNFIGFSSRAADMLNRIAKTESEIPGFNYVDSLNTADLIIYRMIDSFALFDMFELLLRIRRCIFINLIATRIITYDSTHLIRSFYST